MTFEKGSLILIDYTMKIKDSDEVFDTTIEAIAREHSIHEGDEKYRPKLVSVGEMSYPVLAGLDEALAKTSVGDKLTIEVEPAKGFGERRPEKIRMISARKLGEDAEKVSVGDMIKVDNKTATIRFIGSGRIQIDYNHKHAGKTLLFDVSVIKSLDSPTDIINEIIKHRFNVDDSEIPFELHDNKLNIPIPRTIFRADNLPLTKHFVHLDILNFVPTLLSITFLETYVNTKLSAASSTSTQDGKPPSSAVAAAAAGEGGQPLHVDGTPDTAPAAQGDDGGGGTPDTAPAAQGDDGGGGTPDTAARREAPKTGQGQS